MAHSVNSPEWHFQQILRHLGEDVSREGLIETPKRFIKMMREVTSCPDFNLTQFENDMGQEPVVVTGIPFYSLCEHHAAPFFGTAKIGYVPNKTIVGISKIPRVLDMFSKRLQNQERITKQVAEYIMEKINPLGVAVCIEARHLCMEMRGVKKCGANTVTTYFSGKYFEDAENKKQFLNR